MLVTPVGIANIEPLRKPDVEARRYIAIWDTGASGTVVTRKVVKECGLIPTSQTKIVGVNSSRLSDVYLVDIHLPNQVIVQEHRVAEAEALAGDDAQVLIGMDIIGLGDFAVSNFRDRTSFTFRIPSLEEIDFVPSGPPSVGRNDPCPCGSGKKFKKCHGQ